tara:strand:+ start:1338 stop:3104 length:1767 start_codon:yes stop_codon:yes gene_type:complete
MKTSQTIEIWKRFLKEQQELDEEVLEEEEPFQKAIKKGYLKDRDEYLTSGPQKTGGAPFDKNPKRSRAESSPPTGEPVAEGLLDRIKNVFGGRKAAGKTAQDQDGDLNFDLNTKEVDIAFEDGKYVGTGEEALKDREVLRLVAAFVQQVPEVNVAELEQMIRLDPTRGIRFLLNQTGMSLQSSEGDSDPKPPAVPSQIEISIEKEIMPAFRSEFNNTFYSNKEKYEDVFSSILGKKVVDKTPPEIGEKDFFSLIKSKGFDKKESEALRDLIGKKKIVKENLSINNVSGADLAELIQNINKFYPYAQEYLKFDRPVSLSLVSDPNNAKDTFGKTAYYNPNNDQITIFVDKRHPKDMIRSFSHELVHHAQNCRGEFDKDFVAGENYVEENDHLNLMEREAYEKGNMCLRYYESYLKKENKKMSLNEETLRKAIREAIKRVTESKTATEETVDEAHCPGTRDDEKMEEDTFTEDSGGEESEHDRKNAHDDDYHIKEIERHLDALKGDRDYEEKEEMDEGADQNTGMSGMAGDDDKKTYMGRMKEEEAVEEASCGSHDRDDEMNEGTTSINESFNQAKGKLIFNRLVDKWCK